MNESCTFSSLQLVIFFMQNLKIKWLDSGMMIFTCLQLCNILTIWPELAKIIQGIEYISTKCLPLVCPQH